MAILPGGMMAAKKLNGITPRMIKYGNGITAVRALPKAKGKRPAVIILHERYGIDQHTKDLTARLAQAGFVGLAPDLFHRFKIGRASCRERTDSNPLEVESQKK